VCQGCEERQERIKRLERRIHNQRVALRQNWQIVDMRTGLAQPKEVRSRLLAGWSRASREARELRERLAKYEPTE
jgi:PleD family two-component response regulator